MKRGKVLLYTKAKLKAEEARIRRIEEIYKKYGKILIAETYKNYIREYAIAEDIVQTAFERAIKHGYNFLELEDVEAFRLLYSIMKHEAYKVLKKGKMDYLIVSIDNILDNLVYTDIKQEHNPEFLHLERVMVHEAIAKLPEDYASVLYLHYFYGYKFKEIAVLLDISENTAIQRNHYIRKKLKEILKREGF